MFDSFGSLRNDSDKSTPPPPIFLPTLVNNEVLIQSLNRSPRGPKFPWETTEERLSLRNLSTVDEVLLDPVRPRTEYSLSSTNVKNDTRRTMFGSTMFLS